MAQSVTLSEYGWSVVEAALSSDISEATRDGRWATAAATAEQLGNIHRQRGNAAGVDHCRRMVTSFRHLSDIDRKAKKEHQS